MSLSHAVPVARAVPSSGRAVHDAHDAALHTWRLSGVDFEDGLTTRCFECTGCGAVRFS